MIFCRGALKKPPPPICKVNEVEYKVNKCYFYKYKNYVFTRLWCILRQIERITEKNVTLQITNITLNLLTSHVHCIMNSINDKFYFKK